MNIHPTALVDPTARLADDVIVGPNALIEGGVEIGPGCEIMGGAVILRGTRMGARNRVGHHAVIGGDPQHLAFRRETPTGVRIGDDNNLREMCTIHRGAVREGADTVVGNNNLLMVNAHVGHDAVVGNNCVIANGSLLSGHVELCDNVFISGLCAIHQFVRIGRMAMLSGGTGISQNVAPFCTIRGAPGVLLGLNIVGMRRAGIPSETRSALRRAYKTLFLSGKSITKAVAEVRAAHEGRAMPPELEEMLAFCSHPGRHGVLAKTHYRGIASDPADEGAE